MNSTLLHIHGRAAAGRRPPAAPLRTERRQRQQRPPPPPPPRAAATPADNPPPQPPALRTPSPIPQAPLGRTGLTVPRICLGTMLFGESGPTLDYRGAARLMAGAAERGASFYDSSEMYPVPPSRETHGRSEEYLGRWAKEHGRSKVTLCTKVSGPGNLPWIRDGPISLDAKNIAAALDASLKRMQTDHLDLLLLHWPDRWVPMFGDRDYDPGTAGYSACPLEEQLEALGEAVRLGKARAVGLSNETAWGVARCGALAEFSSSSSTPLPRVAATQNTYSLLCRTAEVAGGLMEACDREGVGLLAYAPLAAGHLTGKYLSPPAPAGTSGPATAESRLIKYRGRYAEAEMRYAFDKPGLEEATRAYVSLAAELGLTPAALALRFVLSRPARLVPSAVIGATDLAQLEELLDAAAGGDGRGGRLAGSAGAALGGGCLEGVGLPPEVLERIDAIHERHPNPLP